jgi:hypothetical protein
MGCCWIVWAAAEASGARQWKPDGDEAQSPVVFISHRSGSAGKSDDCALLTLLLTKVCCKFAGSVPLV